ncbi:MAG: extracellular solute-binding protein [Clostridia bacterium]|nr:extracellular solute-binding protein [Clostridia bacterium]
MMKKILAILLALLLLTLLCSCHGAKTLDSFEIPEEFDENKQYEISFWAKNDNNTDQQKIYYDAVAGFEKLYPNINVTIRAFTNYNDIYKEVLTNIQTGTTPNVCITYPDHIATYISGQNTVITLDELLVDEKYGLGGSGVKFDSPTKDEVIAKFLEEGKIDGVQYAIPFMRSTEACYVNVDYVKALGFEMPDKLTWDFIFEVSRAALEPVGQDENGNPIYVNGQSIMIPFLYKSTDNMMIQMLKQKGYDYSSDDGEILIFNDGTKELLYMVAEKVKDKTLTTFDIENAYPGDLINSGHCIFGVDSTAGATWIGSGAPHYEISADQIVDFELAVREIPQFDPENPVMISQGPSICIFNKSDNGEVLASWLFAQYLISNEVQIAYSQTEGYLPVTSKVLNSAEYQDYLSKAGQLDENGNSDFYYAPKIAASKLLLDNIDNTFITPVFNGSASLRNAAGLMIEETGKSVRRGMEINDAKLESIFSKVKSLYKLGELKDSSGGERELGPLPTTSILLLASIGLIWVGIGGYVLYGYIDSRKKRDKQN